jgi:hypothetical protein
MIRGFLANHKKRYQDDLKKERADWSKPDREAIKAYKETLSTNKLVINDKTVVEIGNEEEDEGNWEDVDEEQSDEEDQDDVRSLAAAQTVE